MWILHWTSGFRKPWSLLVTKYYSHTFLLSFSTVQNDIMKHPLLLFSVTIADLHYTWNIYHGLLTKHRLWLCLSVASIFHVMANKTWLFFVANKRDCVHFCYRFLERIFVSNVITCFVTYFCRIIYVVFRYFSYALFTLFSLWILTLSIVLIRIFFRSYNDHYFQSIFF